MSTSLVVRTIKGSPDGSGVTTDAVNSSTANLAIVSISWYSGIEDPSTPTDSKSNTYTPLTKRTGTDQSNRLYYCLGPTVGSGHTVTVGSPTGNVYCVVEVMFFTGDASWVFDTENGAGATAVTSKQPGSITPTANGAIVVSGIGSGLATSFTVNGSFVAETLDTSGGAHVGGGAAYLIQTSAAAANPTWSWTNSGNAAASIASFVPSGGGAATAYTFTGPTSGTVNVASTNFTVTPDGDATGITVTPASDGSGSFTPSSVTFTGSGAETFTYTPTSTSGSPHTLSVTDNGGLTDPSSIDYTVNPAPVTINVTDSDWFFSPYNWYKSGSTYAQTTNPGAYFKTKWTGTSIKLNVDVSVLSGASTSAGDYPRFLYRVDGNTYTSRLLTSADTQITLATGLSDTTHTLEVVLVACAWDSKDRWNTPIMAFRVTGMELDPLKDVATPDIYSGRMIVYGDSHSEGHEVTAAGVSVTNQDASLAAPFILGRAFECEVGVVAFAGQGWAVSNGSNHNVPKLEDAWDFYYSGQSRLSGGLFSPAPGFIVVLEGKNDSSGVQAAVEATLPGWRTAAPSARIVVGLPPNLENEAVIRAGVTSVSDANTVVVDQNEQLAVGPWIFGSHINQRGHSRWAAIIAKQSSTNSASFGRTVSITNIGTY